MIIRQATLDDIPSVMDLLKRVVPAMHLEGNFQWDHTYPNEEVFEKDIALRQLWLAEEQSVIAGFAAITTDQDAEYADVGWDINEEAIVTHRLAVDVHFRGRGVAKALLLKAEEEAYRRDIRLLRIDTNIENQATRALFPRLGYEYSGEIGLGFRPNLRFCCYQKQLSGKSEKDLLNS